MEERRASVTSGRDWQAEMRALKAAAWAWRRSLAEISGLRMKRARAAGVVPRVSAAEWREWAGSAMRAQTLSRVLSGGL
jgi:hypothetical protein